MAKPKRKLVTTRRVMALIAAGSIATTSSVIYRNARAFHFHNEALRIGRYKNIPQSEILGWGHEIWKEMGIAYEPERLVDKPKFHANFFWNVYRAEKKLLEKVKSEKPWEKRKTPEIPKQPRRERIDRPRNPPQQIIDAKATKRLPRSALRRRNA